MKNIILLTTVSVSLLACSFQKLPYAPPQGETQTEAPLPPLESKNTDFITCTISGAKLDFPPWREMQETAFSIRKGQFLKVDVYQKPEAKRSAYVYMHRSNNDQIWACPHNLRQKQSKLSRYCTSFTATYAELVKGTTKPLGVAQKISGGEMSCSFGAGEGSPEIILK